MPVSRQFIPVNPLLDDDGAFVSLKDYTSAPMKPNPFEGADPGYSIYGREYKFSNSFSSKLEMRAIGGLNGSFGSTTFVHDSVVYRVSRAKIIGGSNLVTGTWWGYGLRLKIVVSDAQFGVQANWQAVAAAAQLGYLNAEFEIESIGISDPAIFELLPDPTDLNMETYTEILAAGDKIRNLIQDANPAGMIHKPIRIEVEVPAAGSIDPIQLDRHKVFTMLMVSNRNRRDEAREEAQKIGLDPLLINKFYNDVFGITDAMESDGDDKPSREQARTAEKWIEG